jgi:EAL domain-containing protein (putative c-di-GMP-specific phosphodiesterase class I)
MVEAINTIGHQMGLKTVAEFVESAAILALLQQIGVDYVQGNMVHCPESLVSLCGQS